jgi:hypothetical protein
MDIVVYVPRVLMFIQDSPNAYMARIFDIFEIDWTFTWPGQVANDNRIGSL